jgi:hypothetical protein
MNKNNQSQGTYEDYWSLIYMWFILTFKNNLNIHILPFSYKVLDVHAYMNLFVVTDEEKFKKRYLGTWK